MAGLTLQREGWSLQEAAESDIDTLMEWFTQPSDILIWGGPTFRYPFDRETFFEDVCWGTMASYCLRDPASSLVAFGQLYDRDGRIHLARLIVHPEQRGRGVGTRLIETLITAGIDLFARDEVSLFVFRDNLPAYRCYRSLGFTVSDYPDDMPHADVCYYLTRPAQPEEP